MRNFITTKSITPREHNSLDKYFREINKIALISADEEIMLAERIRNNDPKALERLTKANLRFVVSVAKQYQHQGVPLEDLINEGNFGLIAAARRFDESRGFKFISYAVWGIRQAIAMAIAEKARMVRLPHNQLDLLAKFYKICSKLEQDHQRNPAIEEIALHLELPVQKVTELLCKSDNYHLSIDEPFRQDDDHSLLEILTNGDPGPDYLINKEAVLKEIHQALKILNKRDRELLVLYFGLGISSPLSLEEIGRKFDITKEHAGRLKEKALEKLRNCSNAPVLLSCLN